MTDEATKKYVLPEKGNEGFDKVTVDKVTLRKGDLEPKELTDKQVSRVEDSLGAKLEEAGSKQEAGSKLEGAALDAALTDAGVQVASGTSADDKRKALEKALADN
jgi:hypothetical protein